MTDSSPSRKSELIALLEQLDKEATPAPWHHQIEAWNNYVIISDVDQPAHFTQLASGALTVAVRNALPEIIELLKGAARSEKKPSCVPDQPCPTCGHKVRW